MLQLYLNVFYLYLCHFDKYILNIIRYSIKLDVFFMKQLFV